MLRQRLTQARKAAVLLTRPSWRRGLLHGIGATIEHRPLMRLIAPRTVVDIGANKGQFTLFALEAWPDCEVIAFEPLPGAAARFRRLLGRHPRVRLFETAIGPEAGEAPIHISAREDSSSLLPIGAEMARHFPGTQEVGTRLVEVRPLAAMLGAADLKAPCLLKIDVQGYELEALRGCLPHLHRLDHLYIECSHVELYEGQALAGEVGRFLEQHGFVMTASFATGEGGDAGHPTTALQSDCLFERRAASSP